MSVEVSHELCGVAVVTRVEAGFVEARVEAGEVDVYVPRNLLNKQEMAPTLGDLLYLEADPSERTTRIDHRAALVRPLLQVWTRVTHLFRGHGFLHCHLGPVFFPGATVVDDLLEFRNLQSSLRLGDQLRALVWSQDGLTLSSGDHATKLKAARVFLPDAMRTSEKRRPLLGFVTRRLAADKLVLFSKPTGYVLLRLRSFAAFPVEEPQLGERYKFDLVALAEPLTFTLRSNTYTIEFAARDAVLCDAALLERSPAVASEVAPPARPLCRPAAALSPAGKTVNTVSSCVLKTARWQKEAADVVASKALKPVGQDAFVPLPPNLDDACGYRHASAQTDNDLAELKVVSAMLSDPDILRLMMRRHADLLSKLVGAID